MTSDESLRRVFLYRTGSYDSLDVTHSFERLMRDLSDLSGIVSRGERILVKPNLLTAAHPDRSTTTHPAILEAVLTILLDCIRCYCCQELCPHGAIEARKGPLGFMVPKKAGI